MKIRILARRGMGIRAIARELGISRNTVRRYSRGEAVVEVGRRGTGRPRKLAPYEDWLRRRVRSAVPVQLPATVLHREVAAMDYDGTERTVRRFVAKLHRGRAPEPVVRFETTPGEQGVDGLERAPPGSHQGVRVRRGVGVQLLDVPGIRAVDALRGPRRLSPADARCVRRGAARDPPGDVLRNIIRNHQFRTAPEELERANVRCRPVWEAAEPLVPCAWTTSGSPPWPLPENREGSHCGRVVPRRSAPGLGPPGPCG